MQEVDEAAPRSRRLDLARELAQAADFPHWAVGHNVRLSEGRYGNATLSRHPIETHGNVDLTIGRLKRRGCLHTRVRLAPQHGNEHRLDVFNLHLGLSAMERARQLRRLAAHAEFASRPLDDPVLLGGDFNDWRSLLWTPLVQALGFRCATEIGETAGRRFLRTYPAFSPRGALDRLYHRGPLRVLEARVSRLAAARVASDHLPVVAEFELR